MSSIDTDYIIILSKDRRMKLSLERHRFLGKDIARITIKEIRDLSSCEDVKDSSLTDDERKTAWGYIEMLAYKIRNLYDRIYIDLRGTDYFKIYPYESLYNLAVTDKQKWLPAPDYLDGKHILEYKGGDYENKPCVVIS